MQKKLSQSPSRVRSSSRIKDTEVRTAQESVGGKMVTNVYVGPYKYCTSDIVGKGYTSTVYKAFHMENSR